MKTEETPEETAMRIHATVIAELRSKSPMSTDAEITLEKYELYDELKGKTAEELKEDLSIIIEKNNELKKRNRGKNYSVQNEETIKRFDYIIKRRTWHYNDVYGYDLNFIPQHPWVK
jgi:hypothetical protein